MGRIQRLHHVDVSAPTTHTKHTTPTHTTQPITQSIHRNQNIELHKVLRLRRIFTENIIHGMVQDRNTYLQTRQEEKDRQQIERWQGQESEARLGNCLQPDSAAVKWIPRWMEIYGDSKPPVKETPQELLRKAPPPPAAWCWECSKHRLAAPKPAAVAQSKDEESIDSAARRSGIGYLGKQSQCGGARPTTTWAETILFHDRWAAQ